MSIGYLTIIKEFREKGNICLFYYWKVSYLSSEDMCKESDIAEVNNIT